MVKRGFTAILVLLVLSICSINIAFASTISYSNQTNKMEPIVEDVKKYTKGTYDTYILRNNANFKIQIADGVHMVPFNTLGKGQYTDTEILKIINTRDPQYIKEAISTVYDAYQYFYLSQFKSLPSDHFKIKDEEGLSWEVHKTGEEAILTNEGDCSGFAALLNYLIEDDYDEAGYFSYNQYDGNGHVLNYIKKDNKYYFIDMTNMNLAITETGKLPNTLDLACRGNLHEADSLKAYIEFYRTMINDKALTFNLSKGNEVQAIASYIKEDIRYYEIPETYDFQLVADYSNGKIKIIRSNGKIDNVKWNNYPKVLNNRELIGDIYIRYDVRISEYAQYDWGNYDLYLLTDGDLPVELNSLNVKYYDNQNKIIFEDFLGQEELLTHYPNLTIRKENGRGIRIGFASLAQLIKNHKLAYAIIQVDAVDLNNNKINKSFKIDLSKYDKGYVNINKNNMSSPYDMDTLRYNAEFRIPITNGVYWVPVNTLGLPNTSMERIKKLYEDYRYSNPEKIKEEIDSLYEALLFIKLTDKIAGDANIKIHEDSLYWEHHMPGEVAIYAQDMNCASLSDLLYYLLKDDYDEVGFIWLSQSDGQGHVFNYIK